MPDPSWEQDGKRWIYVNLDEADVAPPRRPDIFLQADAAAAVSGLASRVRERQAFGAEGAARVKRWEREEIAATGILARYVFAIRNALPDDGIFVNELTQVGYLARVAFEVRGPRTLIGPGYQGTLGYSFPTALGAAAGAGGRRVFAISGDGGFGWSYQELATARRYDLPVTLVVFNDGHFGNVARHPAPDLRARVRGRAAESGLPDARRRVLRSVCARVGAGGARSRAAGFGSGGGAHAGRGSRGRDAKSMASSATEAYAWRKRRRQPAGSLVSMADPVAGMNEAVAEELRRLMTNGGCVVSDPEEAAPYLLEYRWRGVGEAACVACPASVEEVRAVVRYCARHGLTITPQGGNTGLSGGASARSETTVLLSLRGLARIRDVSVDGRYVVADAGATLHEVNEAVAGAGLFLPVDIGSRGSATLGGVVSTNAGGMNVLRYGSTREQVLGLEVVLADGELWDGLRANRKDNSGPDLKHLFVGTEGTLGIVTGVCMRLATAETHSATVLLEAPSMREVIALLGLAQNVGGERLTSFELMSGFAVREAARRVLGVEPPLGATGEWYVLVRYVGTSDVSGMAAVFAGQAMEGGLAPDGTLPRSLAEEARLWRIRDCFSELHRHLGPSLRFDIAVPVDRLEVLVARLHAARDEHVPQCDILCFGHMGDGNLHFSICSADAALPGEAAGINVKHVVHAIVWDLGGTISAEHGIGRLHVAELEGQKSAIERRLAAKVKMALDPGTILNPGAIFPVDDSSLT